MTTFPMTYIGILIWIIIISFQSDNLELKLYYKIFGSIFGIFVAIFSITGERWLFIDSTGTFTVKIVDTGFGKPIGVIVIAMSIVMLIFSILGYIELRKTSKSL